MGGKGSRARGHDSEAGMMAAVVVVVVVAVAAMVVCGVVERLWYLIMDFMLSTNGFVRLRGVEGKLGL